LGSKTEYGVVHVLQKVQLTLQRGLDCALVVLPAACIVRVVQICENAVYQLRDEKVNHI